MPLTVLLLIIFSISSVKSLLHNTSLNLSEKDERLIEFAENAFSPKLPSISLTSAPGNGIGSNQKNTVYTDSTECKDFRRKTSRIVEVIEDDIGEISMVSNASCADLGPQSPRRTHSNQFLEMPTEPTPMQLKAVVDRKIMANRKRLAEIDFNSLLGECGLYFTSVSNPEMTNEEFKKSVGDGAAEFMLVIHLAPFKDIKNDEGVYQTPVELRTLNCPLKTLASLLPHVYGIDAPRLYHVSA
jgi:hypothetical protein